METAGQDANYNGLGTGAVLSEHAALEMGRVGVRSKGGFSSQL